jgi:hypothetical protein
MPLVQHPNFEHIVKDVTAEAAKLWTDAGWIRVKKDDEDTVRAKAELPPVA